jgi:hypothetical protein
MHSLGDDNELDRLSREAAGTYDHPGSPDWPKMSATLDKVLPVERKRRGMLLWWLAPVLLLGGGGYWLMKSNADHAIPATAVSAPAVQKPVALQPAAETKTITAETDPESAAAPINTPKVHALQNPASQTAHVNYKAPAVRGNSTTAVNANRNEKAILTPATNSAAAAPGIKQESKTVSASEQKTYLAAQPPVSGTTKAAPNKTEASSEKAGEKITPKEETQAAPETTPLHRQEKLAPAVFGKGWSVAFLAGADKSTVKFRYDNDPGYNLGILAGYHLNSHLSVHTGVVYTQKNYKMAGEDFTAPKGSLPSYYKLENVEGYCRMWDVPLLLRYTFSPKGKNDFYATAGLSSYFMTNENYNYFFYYQGNPVTRNVNYDSDDTHVLSILHLSGGFETRLAGNRTLQIEPYAKLPLGGVGLGNISLSSFGVNVALQLRQPTKK